MLPFIMVNKDVYSQDCSCSFLTHSVYASRAKTPLNIIPCSARKSRCITYLVLPTSFYDAITTWLTGMTTRH